MENATAGRARFGEFLLGKENHPFPFERLAVVWMIQAAAHAFREHARVVRPGGLVIITIPHLGPWTPVRLFVWWRRFRHLGSFEQVLGRNLRLREVRRMFQDAGLNVRLCVGAGTSLRVPTWIAHWMSHILPEHKFGRYLICVGQKSIGR